MRHCAQDSGVNEASCEPKREISEATLTTDRRQTTGNGAELKLHCNYNTARPKCELLWREKKEITVATDRPSAHNNHKAGRTSALFQPPAT